MRKATKQSDTGMSTANEAGFPFDCELAGRCFPVEPPVRQEDGGGVAW